MHFLDILSPGNVSVGNVFYVEQNVIIEPNLQLIDNTCMTKFAAR